MIENHSLKTTPMRQLKITKSITTRDSEHFQRYLQEISKIELITPEEEVELGVKIKQGDQRALEKLTKANLRFVVSVAKQYQNQGLSLNDLVNEGNLGLVKAASRFDETRGFKFISYAVWWIRQSILQALAENSRIVRLPTSKISLSNKIEKAFSQLEQEYEREPSVEEIADLIDIPEYFVEEMTAFQWRHASLDAATKEGEENSLLEMLENTNSEYADVDVVHTKSLEVQVNRVLSTLPKRQEEVIRLYFGIGCKQMSLEDIGEKYELTRERVRQIKDKAISLLSTRSRSSLLKNYLG